MELRSLTHRAPLLYLVLPFATGIALQRATDLGHERILLAAAAIVSAASLRILRLFAANPIPRPPNPHSALRNPQFFALPALALILAGAASASHARRRIAGWENLPPRAVQVSIRITTLFHSADPRRISGLATITKAPATVRDLEGQRTYFSAATLRAVSAVEPLAPSAILTISGLLSPISESPEPGSFDTYLVDSGVNLRIARARIVAVDRPPDRFHRFCQRAAIRLAAILGLGIADRRPDLTGIYRAMLLGWQSELTADQRDNYLLSGTMHLFSVSGLHVVVISVALEGLLVALRVPHRVATVVTAALTGLHVVITGSSPAAIRAFLLVAFKSAAVLLRQPANGLAALAAAALVVLLGDPLALFSASFQMSYGAVLAILLYGLPLGERLFEAVQPNRSLPRVSWTRIHHVKYTVTEYLCPAITLGLAATLVGTVTGITYFRVFAPVSFLVNLAVIPIAQLAIIGGSASIACGLAAFPAAAVLFNNAAAVDLLVVDHLVQASITIPGAWYPADWRSPWLGPTSLIALISILLTGYHLGWKPKYAAYWPPIILTTLIIALGTRIS